MVIGGTVPRAFSELTSMKTAAENLRLLVRIRGAMLRDRREPDVSQPGALGKWTKKQILGHLCDSALNTHQCLVRAQVGTGGLEFPGHDQDAWVRVQDYLNADWDLLIDLWRSISLHMACVIEQLLADRLKTPCRIGGREAVTLRFLTEDYIKHLEHHLSLL